MGRAFLLFVRPLAWLTFAFVGAPFGTPLAASPVPQESAESRLVELASPDSVVRERARLWLIENLGEQDRDALRLAAMGADLQARLVLADVLAAHPRHFALAVDLGSHPEVGPAQVGRWALEQSALAWNPALADGPQPPRELPEEWTETQAEGLWLVTDPKDARPGGLPLALDRLARFGDAPVALVLDPALHPLRSMAQPALMSVREELRGPWHEILLDLARAHRASFEVWAWRPEPVAGFTLKESEEVRSTPFLRVRRMGSPTLQSGQGLLVDWVLGAKQTQDPRAARANALSLAQVGWPAAILWLQQEALAGRQDFWRAACVAARSGAVAPQLMQERGVRALLAWVASNSPKEKGLGDSSEWSSVDLARQALERYPARLIGGQALAEILMPTVEANPELGQPTPERLWLCFTVCQSRRQPSAGVARWALSALKDPERDLDLRRSALGAVWASGTGSIGGLLPDTAGLLESLSPRAFQRMVGLARAIKLGPDKVTDLAQRFPEHVGDLALWIQACPRDASAGGVPASEWLWGVLQGQTAARQSALLGTFAGAIAQGRGDLVRSLLADLRGDPKRQRVADRLSASLGILEFQRASDWLASLMDEANKGAETWLDIALFSAHEGLGSRARGALLGALGSEIPAVDLEPALLLARERLLASRDALLLERFEEELRRASRRSSHPLAGVLQDWDWGSMPIPMASEPLGADQPRPPK